MAAIEIHDLAEQRDFLYSLRDERANFGDDFRNGAAALSASRAGHNAKGAMHVASLHDRHERRRLLWREGLIANGRLRTDFFFHIDDRKTKIVHSIKAGISDPDYRTLSCDHVIHVIGDAMEFLRPNYKIEMWDFFQQLRAPCLRHAAEKSKDGFRPALCHAAEHSHFAQRLLLGHVANATGIEQHNIGVRLATHVLVAPGNERMCDLLGIALVHLAAVSLDEKFRHGSRTIHRGGGSATPLGWVAKRPGNGFAFKRRRTSSLVHGSEPTSLNRAMPMTPTLRVL